MLRVGTTPWTLCVHHANVLMGRSRYKIYDHQAPHVLTCTVAGWLPVFIHPDLAHVILDSLRFLHTKGRLTLYAYVLMENHLHLIASAEALQKEISRFKSYTARAIVDLLKATGRRPLLRQLSRHKRAHKNDRNYQFWQEGSHPQCIQGDAMLRQKLDYLHFNPVRRGYVDDPAHWRYSSARNYAGQPGLIDVTLAL